jgi:hypothetical protein
MLNANLIMVASRVRPPLQTLHGAFNLKRSFKDLRRQAEITAENEAKEEGG